MREGAISREKRRDYPSLALWKTGFTTGQFLPADTAVVLSDFQKRELGVFSEDGAIRKSIRAYAERRKIYYGGISAKIR